MNSPDTIVAADEPGTALFYLRWPKLVVLATLALMALAASFVPQFRFDASSDTLVVEGDPDLAQFLEVAETFGGEDFLVLTFAPRDGALISPTARGRRSAGKRQAISSATCEPNENPIATQSSPASGCTDCCANLVA